MGEKLAAGIVTAVVFPPICAVCILGFAAVGSLLAGAFGWLGGLGPLATIALMIAGGMLVYGLFSQRKARTEPSHKSISGPRPLVAQGAGNGAKAPDDRRDTAVG